MPEIKHYYCYFLIIIIIIIIIAIIIIIRGIRDESNNKCRNNTKLNT